MAAVRIPKILLLTNEPEGPSERHSSGPAHARLRRSDLKKNTLLVLLLILDNDDVSLSSCALQDAHGHVIHCPEKVRGDDPFYASKEDWLAVQTRRQAALVLAYVQGLQELLRPKVMRACAHVLRGAGLGDVVGHFGAPEEEEEDVRENDDFDFAVGLQFGDD